MLLDTWMLSGPKTENMWYNKPRETLNDMLENIGQAKDGIEFESDSECLVMRKYSKFNQKFSLAIGACNIKRSAICRIDPQTASSLAEAPKFPCLNPDGVHRSKRETADSPEKETGLGLLLHNAYYHIKTYVI